MIRTSLRPIYDSRVSYNYRMAFYGGSFAQCQSLDKPLAVQLNSGIRMLDIRLAVKKHNVADVVGCAIASSLEVDTVPWEYD